MVGVMRAVGGDKSDMENRMPLLQILELLMEYAGHDYDEGVWVYLPISTRAR